jgi:acyl-CoA dehydrogenase
MDFAPSDRSRELAGRVRAFVHERITPVEREVLADAADGGADWRSWRVHPAVRELQAAARADGLWNLFHRGPDRAPLSSVDYAPVAEAMGHSPLAPEIFNCNAPDTGNMELLARYGTEDQQRRWLDPLERAEIRSAFCMTEPDVASSDATNLVATARLDGDDVVIDGRKWWSTGLGHPDLRVLIVMGLTLPDASRHARHSMVIVPVDTPGVTIERMLPVFGAYDAPYGHGQVRFDGVRVPRANLLGGPGQGFALAQARLGPGRIHHCMRCIGAAERAFELLIRRATTRVAFGRPLIDQGGNRERVADLRVAIDQARLLVLHAAWRLDAVGAMEALSDVSAIKLVAPTVLERVADEAIQMFGAAGLSDDTPLAASFAMARVLRLADGPDAVHRAVIAKREIARFGG